MTRTSRTSKALVQRVCTRVPIAALVAALGACATGQRASEVIETPVRVVQPDEPSRPASKPIAKPPAADPARAAPKAPVRSAQPAATRTLIEYLIPAGVSDRAGWAADIHAALSALELPASPDNVCSIIAITEQESSFRADPSVPGLPKIARKEIDRQSERMGVPKFVVQTALKMPSANGKTYTERLDSVETERQLSEIFDDFIGRVPLGKTLLADRNPVRTGGPMQVSVSYAEKHAATRKYPYPVPSTIRDEVFTRRGGVYFGAAHLLDYAASYDNRIYRFADYNAGQYASRNAGFQNALTIASGIAIELDGDLLRYDQGKAMAQPGNTELAVRAMGKKLDMSAADIRRDLERGKSIEFERTKLYARVFALADKANGHPVPRAVLPDLRLQSPKITRKLTTAWFAQRVEERHKRCLVRAGEAG